MTVEQLVVKDAHRAGCRVIVHKTPALKSPG
jgi:hypothetical protein